MSATAADSRATRSARRPMTNPLELTEVADRRRPSRAERSRRRAARAAETDAEPAAEFDEARRVAEPPRAISRGRTGRSMTTTTRRRRRGRARRRRRPCRPPVGRARDRRDGQGRRRPHPRRALPGAVAGLRLRGRRRPKPGRICRAARGIGREGAGPRADDADRQARLRHRLRQGAADRIRGGAVLCPAPGHRARRVPGLHRKAAGRPQGTGRRRTRRRAGPRPRPIRKGEAARAQLRSAPAAVARRRARPARSSRSSSPAAAPTARTSRSRSSTTKRWSNARSAGPPSCPPGLSAVARPGL